MEWTRPSIHFDSTFGNKRKRKFNKKLLKKMPKKTKEPRTNPKEKK